ncbi:MAG TPA: alpha/beta fold hydrolase [Vicinamibacterales bacterium]|nr:alpha/beta fold hydrolase [Vicinamibacterales bacterium]
MRFSPKPSLRNGHVMTLYAWAMPRRFPRLPSPVPRYFDVAEDARVLAHCHWQERPRAAATIVGLHGLEASSGAHYMCGLADKAYAAGFNVVLLNQRNCGGTEALSAGLYHSGLTADTRAVISELRALDGLTSFIVAGYSLGGNLALKLAGEYGDAAPPELLGVAAVSPVIEVGACVRALERRSNVVYQWNFVRSLKARMRRKDEAWPGRFPIERLGRVRTVRMFDEVFTAPHFGFRNADDYYYRASAMRVIDRVRVPALIVTAEDDPFVPPEPFRDARVTGNPVITMELTKHGGHCAFVSSNGTGDRYWAEERILAFATGLVRPGASREAASRAAAQPPALRA